MDVLFFVLLVCAIAWFNLRINGGNVPEDDFDDISSPCSIADVGARLFWSDEDD